MTEDQKLDLILDTIEDLQNFIYSLKIAADNYIDSDTSLNDSLENLNAEADFNTIQEHMRDLIWLFMDTR